MKTYLYVLDTMADWEAGYLLAELNSGRFFRKGCSPVRTVLVGSSLNEVATMGGIRITPDVSIDSLTMTTEDLLLLPGADTWMDEAQRTVLLTAKERIAEGGRVAAICGATIGLAAVGALDGVEHTSNALDVLKMLCPGYTGESLYRNAPAVTAGSLVTASGFAPLEFSREVLALLDVFKPETLDAWYNLNVKKEAEYYFALMESMV